LVDGVRDRRRDLPVDGRLPGVVTARRLRPLVGWAAKVERVDERCVDIVGGLVVATDGDDNGVVLRGPHRKHPVTAVEVPAADVIQRRTREAVARFLAPAIAQSGQHRAGCLAVCTSQLAYLSIRRSRQLDLDRDRFAPLVAASSASRSSDKGTTRPEAKSSKPSRAPGMSSAARSRS
jgi:hypothetical protein